MIASREGGDFQRQWLVRIRHHYLGGACPGMCTVALVSMKCGIFLGIIDTANVALRNNNLATTEETCIQ